MAILSVIDLVKISFIILSRLPNIENKAPVEIEQHQDEIHCEIDHIDLDLINVPLVKQTSISESTMNDPTLSALSQIIHSGWPETIKE